MYKYSFDIFLENKLRDKGQIAPFVTETYWQMIACDLALHHLVSCYHGNRQLQCHNFLVFYAVYWETATEQQGTLIRNPFSCHACMNVQMCFHIFITYTAAMIFFIEFVHVLLLLHWCILNNYLIMLHHGSNSYNN